MLSWMRWRVAVAHVAAAVVVVAVVVVARVDAALVDCDDVADIDDRVVHLEEKSWHGDNYDWFKDLYFDSTNPLQSIDR